MAGNVFYAACLPDPNVLPEKRVMQACGNFNSLSVLGKHRPSVGSLPAMVEVILSVCEGRYVRLSALAELLNRDPDGLRKGYLDALVREHRIRRAFPGTPTHELQSYRKAEE